MEEIDWDIFANTISPENQSQILGRILRYMGAERNLLDFIVKLMDSDNEKYANMFIDEIRWYKKNTFRRDDIPSKYKNVKGIEEYCYSEDTEYEHRRGLDISLNYFCGEEIVILTDSEEEDCFVHFWVCEDDILRCCYCDKVNKCEDHDWDIYEKKLDYQYINTEISCAECGFIKKDVPQKCEHGYFPKEFSEWDHLLCPNHNHTPDRKKILDVVNQLKYNNNNNK